MMHQLLQDLIGFATVNPPGNEQPAAEYLAGVLAPLGFATKVQTLAPGRANLIASYAFAQPGPVLALSGHLDVVQAQGWRQDPFCLRQEGERYYGRGVCDMKGAVAAMVAAAAEILKHKDQLCGTLQLVFVADEEVGSRGSYAFLETEPRPDFVLIGEPTSMDVCVGHRGVVRYYADIAGTAAHASTPQKGDNALYAAARFLLEVEAQNQRLQSHTHPLLPPPTIAATQIQGGEQGNTVPAACRLVVDRRILPEENGDTVRAEAAELCRKAGIAPAAVDIFVETFAGQPPAGSPWARRCQKVLQALGHPARIRDFGAGCDQFIFLRQGVDCLLVGPGHLAQAHTQDEYVELGQLTLAQDFYTRFVLQELGRT